MGITFNPANRPSPGSNTWLMMWLWRALPNSFKANKERMAWPAGIIWDPGRPARSIIESKGVWAREGRKRNNPPNWVRKRRGDRSSCRTSAIGATSGRTRGGRS
ncbi:MAG: hypothetical protein ACYTF6_15285 [Planctomycetota bacterium]